MEGDEDSSACVTAVASIAKNEKERKKRAKDKCWDNKKLWWEDVYNHWKDEDFKGKIRINRETFNFVLNEIPDDIVMSPTNVKPFPTHPDRQLAMTLYRFATWCTYSTFGSSIFHKILKGDVLPDRGISLGDFGYVPLFTVGDSAFPQFSWRIKGYNENTRDKQQRNVNN